MKNKKYIFYFSATGVISQSADLQGGIDPAPLVPAGQSCIEVPEETPALMAPHEWAVNTSTRSLQRRDPALLTGVLQSRRWQGFDPVSRTWVATLSMKSMLSDVDGAINMERIRRSIEPVEVDGAIFDADAIAQGNIAGKLQEIAARELLGTPIIDSEMLMWRDYTNTNHRFDSQDALRAFLSKLTALIATRGTQLYQWSWLTKEKMRTATDAESLMKLAEGEGLILT